MNGVCLHRCCSISENGYHRHAYPPQWCPLCKHLSTAEEPPALQLVTDERPARGAAFAQFICGPRSRR